MKCYYESHPDALAYIYHLARAQDVYFTPEKLKRIHYLIFQETEPEKAGKYREGEMKVGDFSPPSPASVPSLMEDLCLWLNLPQTKKRHPVEVAALAYYQLMNIHPFHDGNGRVAHFLYNLYLLSYNYPFTDIPDGWKVELYKSLRSADEGDFEPIIRFISRCVHKALREHIQGITVDYSRGKK